MLLQAPSAGASAVYLLGPVMIAVGASILGAAICLPLALVPVCLIWFALRLGRFHTIMRERVLPPGAAVAPGVRSLGCAAMVLSRTIIAVSVVVVVASLAVLGWCTVNGSI
jgi:hypothetical protein